MDSRAQIWLTLHMPRQKRTSESDSFKLGAVLDFMRLLWAIDHGLQSASKKMEMTLGVTGRQRLVVRIIGKFPGIGAGHLARVLHVHPSTLTGILQRLESRNVIERRSETRDKRRARFFLLREGHRIDESISGTVEGKVRRALRLLSPQDITTTRRVLALIADELTPDSEAAGRNHGL